MKNKIFVSLMILGFLTGCSSPRWASEQDIFEYLKKKYSNETFEIINKLHVENVGGSCKTSAMEGYKYVVKSTTTNIEFEVKDTYEERSGGFCGYDIADNYRRISMDKYINEFNDNRIEPDTKYIFADIKVDYSKFNSIQELSNVLYNFKIYYENKHPFIDSNVIVEADFYKSNTYVGKAIVLSSNHSEITLDSLNDELNRKLNGELNS